MCIFQYFSRACAIRDDGYNSVVVTGGSTTLSIFDRVVRYNRQGNFTDLPKLNIGRFGHACGHYINDKNQKVI